MHKGGTPHTPGTQRAYGIAAIYVGVNRRWFSLDLIARLSASYRRLSKKQQYIKTNKSKNTFVSCIDVCRVGGWNRSPLQKMYVLTPKVYYSTFLKGGIFGGVGGND